MLELVELEMRELLNTYGFEGEETPIIFGSALCALEERQPEIGVDRIDELLKAVDEWIPTPQRDTDKPFLMSIEEVFSISGRGTVVSGRVERGILKKDSEVEIVGGSVEPIKTRVTDIETFKKACDESRAGDNSGLLLRGVKREDIRRGMVVAVPGSTKANTEFLVSLYVLTEAEGGRRSGFTTKYRPQLFIRTAGMYFEFMKFPCLVYQVANTLAIQMRRHSSRGPRAKKTQTAWPCRVITWKWSAPPSTLLLLKPVNGSIFGRAVGPSLLVWLLAS